MRYDTQMLPHQDWDKAIRRIKLAAVQAKIALVGTNGHPQVKRLYKALKIR